MNHLRPFYTLPDLARASGKSADTIDLWVTECGCTVDTIPGRGGSRIRIVYAYDLANHMPILARSLATMGLPVRNGDEGA